VVDNLHGPILLLFCLGSNSVRPGTERREIMNKLQKQAFYNLIMIAGIFPFAALLTVMCLKILGEAFSARLIAQNFAISTYFTFIGVTKQALNVFRMRQESKEIYFDERDHLINYEAMKYAYYACYIFLLIGFVFSTGQTGSIPIYVLPLFFSIVAIFAMLAYSVTILIQYGWGGKDGGK
jgi:hypothetical protein